MIKAWLIKASAPICGTDTYYSAYSKKDPLDSNDFPFNEITESLWEDYSYLLHLDDEEYDSEEERDEAWDQAYENWKCDCSFSSEEMDLDEDNPDDYELIYDERND